MNKLNKLQRLNPANLGNGQLAIAIVGMATIHPVTNRIPVARAFCQPFTLVLVIIFLYRMSQTKIGTKICDAVVFVLLMRGLTGK